MNISCSFVGHVGARELLPVDTSTAFGGAAYDPRIAASGCIAIAEQTFGLANACNENAIRGRGQALPWKTVFVFATSAR